MEEKCREDRQRQSDELIRGNYASYEDYKMACGIIRGLDFVLMNIQDIKDANKEQEDD